ncbi:hypothetical protein V8F20_011563 [Naviculisporaceae sp. PSN 640]
MEQNLSHLEVARLKLSQFELDRLNSILDSREFVTAFVQEGWESHWSHITITCDLTLQELHNLGHLPRTQGIRECRKLVRAPVINDEIGIALWEKLATMARDGDPPPNVNGREDQEGQEDEGNPETVRRASQQSIERERMRHEINAMRQYNKTKDRRRSHSPPPEDSRPGYYRGSIASVAGLPLDNSSPYVSVARSLQTHTALPPQSILRTPEPTSPGSELGAGGTEPRRHLRKLSWNLPLPISGRRKSSPSTDLSAYSTTTGATSSTPNTPTVSSSSVSYHSDAMDWEGGFWQQSEKPEALRFNPNWSFVNVDRDTLAVTPEIVLPLTETGGTNREVLVAVEEEEEGDNGGNNVDSENNDNSSNNNDNDNSNNAAEDKEDERVDPFDNTTTVKPPNSPKFVMSAFTTDTSGTPKRSRSLIKKMGIFRKHSLPDMLLGNMGNFGQSLGAGYGSRDKF